MLTSIPPLSLASTILSNLASFDSFDLPCIHNLPCIYNQPSIQTHTRISISLYIAPFWFAFSDSQKTLAHEQLGEEGGYLAYTSESQTFAERVRAGAKKDTTLLLGSLSAAFLLQPRFTFPWMKPLSHQLAMPLPPRVHACVMGTQASLMEEISQLRLPDNSGLCQADS